MKQTSVDLLEDVVVLSMVSRRIPAYKGVFDAI
jgi:hypothetical protein